MSPIQKTLTLPALPLRDMVLFPGSRVPFSVGRAASVKTLELAIKAGDHLLLLTQRDPAVDEPDQEGLYPMGTLALVESLIALPNRHFKVGVKGIARVRLERFHDEGEVVQAEVRILAEPTAAGDVPLLPVFLKTVQAFLQRNPDASRLLSMDQVKELPLGRAVDTVAGLVPAKARDRMSVLEQLEVEPRLHALLKLLEVDSVRHQVERDVDEKTRARLDEDHKQYVLSEKMRIIQEEMGRKGEKDEFTRLRERILSAGMSEEAEKKAIEELERLETMPPQSAEATVSRTYLDWLLGLPWQAFADERLDLDEAELVLDEDHAGLEKVKARILEHLAVMKCLREEAALLEAPSGDTEASAMAGTTLPVAPQGPRIPPPMRGPILCLVGPPGVGKTSLARSIARALNRPFVRFSLGGVRDEAEIRGHRRTYIGSMPGRIVSLMKKAGVRNPLLLLDEIDKMGSDWRGDPSNALLEVLDPEQNPTFQDHYLDVGFDLSQVLFLCTANVRHQIPMPLDDRLEVLELSGYTPMEKLAISQQHLIPKALDRHGMKGASIRFEDEALEKIIHAYTKEAGVRQLEREISGCLRRLARHRLQPEKGEPFDPRITAERVPRLLGPEKFLENPLEDHLPPGVVHGLAWTPTGGDLLTIEATVLPGKGNLKLTGKMGEVMQESAQLALSYVRSRAERLGLAPDFLEKSDLHIHVPEGAIPKDGPSAGITIALAMISALTGIPARGDVAMTGELTLRGMVLPIGGLKEKLLAAHRQARKAVLVPAENARHLEEVPEEVRQQLSFHLVAHMDEVIQLALVRMPEATSPGNSLPGFPSRPPVPPSGLESLPA